MYALPQFATAKQVVGNRNTRGTATSILDAANAHPVDVSIIISALRSKESLFDCLEAVAQLRFSGSLEQLVIGRSPAGEAAQAAERFSARYICSPRGGRAAAWNTGIAESRGKTVALFDADWLPHPRWLEELLPLMTSPLAVAAQGTLCVPDPVVPRTRFYELLGCPCLQQAPGLYRKSFLSEIGGLPLDLEGAELVDLALQAILNGSVFVVNEQAVAERSSHPWWGMSSVLQFLENARILRHVGSFIDEAHSLASERTRAVEFPTLTVAPVKYRFSPYMRLISIGSRTYLLDLCEKRCMALNDNATAVLDEMLRGPTTFESLIEAISTKYEVPRLQVTADLGLLFARLGDQGLLEAVQ